MRAAIPAGARLAGAGTPFDWPQAIGYSRQPFANFPAGQWRCTAGPAGVAIARFGWVNPENGVVFNTQSAGFCAGFVLPLFNLYNWQRVFTLKGALILRAGMTCTLAAAGVFRTRFPLGAQAGARVWTDPATGLPYGANLTGSYVATPFTVTQNGGPGARLPISSFVSPFN